MAVVVVRGGPAVDEVNERGDTLAVLDAHQRRRALVGEVVVPAGCAGVDDGHADTRSGVPVVGLHGARADSDRDTIHFAARRAVVVEALDGRMIRQLPDGPIRKLDRQTVDEPEPTSQLAAEKFDFGRSIRPGLQRHDDS